MTHAVGLVLAPHFSALSVARYQQKVADGLDLYRGRIHFEHVPSYHDAPGLVDAFAARVEEGLSRWPEEERERVHVVFSAHSLPQRVLASGDPYGEQCLETAELVAARAGAAGRTAGRGRTSPRAGRPSRGPGRTSASTSRQLAGQGVRDVVSVPVGFVSDHVEILFDIDHRAAEIAAGLGMRLERPPGAERRPASSSPRSRSSSASAPSRGSWTRGRREGRRRRRWDRRSRGGAAPRVARARRRGTSSSSATTCVGGKVRTEHVDGFVVEAAPDSFLSRKERGVGLCEELGLGDELIGAPPRAPRHRSSGAATSCTRSPRA